MHKYAYKVSESVLLGIFCLFICVQYASATEVRIALKASRGAAISVNQWQPTADYLSHHIPGYQFIIVPYEINSTLNQAVSRGKFDFVFTDSAAYVELNKRYGVTAIATLINKGVGNGRGYTKFGSVIFTRANRSDITSFQDLKGKRFMAVDEQGFGGWRIAWRELLTHGVDPYRDFKLLSFAGGIQQSVVFAVRDGDVDAGCVRTDVLERMANRGEIKMQAFKVLNPKSTGEIEYVHSTRLYPEWPMAKLSHTPKKLADHVAAALLSMKSDSDAATSAEYVGWSKPLDYQSVDKLLQDLAIGPYETSLYVKWKQLLKNYWEYYFIAIVLFATAVILTIIVSLVNRRLTVAKNALEQENQQRKQAQNQLQIYQNHLETIVAERTANLQTHIDELESYSYSIAHDLRTPLRAIVSFSQILEQDAFKKLDDHERDALRRIVSAGKHMATLIDDILELARITRADLCKTTVDVSRICHEIAAELQAQHPQRQVDWRIADNLQANGDEKLITILLQNLLDNAWKYSQGKERVFIEVAKSPQSESTSTHCTVFYVRDNGIGFDMKYKHKIFKPFQRLHRGEYEGSGVGLATVQRVVQRHGGKVWGVGKANEGATFYFALSDVHADAPATDMKMSDKPINRV
jgi:two-component system sensor histidine kinase/response regulator